MPPNSVAIDGSTLAEATRLGELSRSFSAVMAYRSASVGVNDVSIGVDPERVDAATVSAGLLAMLGVQPDLGRHVASDANEPGHERTVILSHGFWMRRFGAVPNVVGTTMTIEGATYRIAGVMPAEFAFPTRDVQLWIPYSLPRPAVECSGETADIA